MEGAVSNTTNVGGSTFNAGTGEQHYGKRLSKKVLKKILEEILADKTFINEISYTKFSNEINNNTSKQRQLKSFRILKNKLKETTLVLSHINKIKESSQEDFSLNPKQKNEILIYVKDLIEKIKSL